MTIDEQILRFKHTTAEEKLVLIVISNGEYKPWNQPCMLRCQEIGDMLGITRTKVLDIMWGLIENNLVISKVENRIRETSLSPRLKKMIKN